MKILFIDLETTGLSDYKHGIVQIAGSLFETDDPAKKLENPIEEFNYFVKPFPGKEISEEALKVNHLTMADIEGFKNPRDVYSKLYLMIGKYINRFDKADKLFLVGYNVRFDDGFFRQWFKDAGDKYYGSYFFNPAIDVMDMAMRKLMKDRPLMENFKLATVARHVGIEFEDEDLHDARGDIDLTIKLWNHFLEN